MHSLRIKRDGSFVSEDFPGSISSMHYRISKTSIMVGYYYDTTSHGYILKNGRYEMFDYPGSISTEARGIAEARPPRHFGEHRNDHEANSNTLLIVGTFFDSASVQHGYLLTRPIRIHEEAEDDVADFE